MSTTVKYNDHEFKGVPDGFIKMQQVLTFSPQETLVWEEHILRMLVRDFYIFYSLIDKFDDGKFIELHFFCRAKDEISITYRMGILVQTMFSRHRPIQDIIEADHKLPDNFPKCIFIENTNVSRGHMDEAPIYKCGQCGKELTQVRPGKHQCDNKKCVKNKN